MLEDAFSDVLLKVPCGCLLTKDWPKSVKTFGQKLKGSFFFARGRGASSYRCPGEAFGVGWSGVVACGK